MTERLFQHGFDKSASGAKLLFLDEPMSGLDPLARREVIELLKELKKEGTTIFLNTHILGDIEDVGDRGIIVHKGKVLQKFNLHEKREEEGYKIFLKDGSFERANNDLLEYMMKTRNYDAEGNKKGVLYDTIVEKIIFIC